MDIDELKARWQQTDAHLTESMRLNALLLRKLDLAKTATTHRKSRFGIAFEIAVNAVGLFLVGDFAADHIREPQFFVPAIALGLYAVALLVASVRQLAAIDAIDYAEPVLTIQKKLASLWILRIRTTLAILLFGPLMWVPLLVVTARGLFGIDVYGAGTLWLAANLVFGLAVIPLAYWLARAYGKRLTALPAVRSLADQIAGFSLTRAMDSLESIRRFEDAA